MCDQIVALMSSEHSQSIIWNEGEDDDNDSRDEDDEGGRIINCVVDRTTEQEESVQTREGFKVRIYFLCEQSCKFHYLGSIRAYLAFQIYHGWSRSN